MFNLTWNPKTRDLMKQKTSGAPEDNMKDSKDLHKSVIFQTRWICVGMIWCSFIQLELLLYGFFRFPMAGNKDLGELASLHRWRVGIFEFHLRRPLFLKLRGQNPTQNKAEIILFQSKQDVPNQRVPGITWIT